MKSPRFSSSLKHLLPNIRFLVVVAGIILFVATYQIGWVGEYAISLLHFIIKNPHLSYETKMKIRRGGWVAFAELVRKNTPSTAVIMYPPSQYNWEYFLYPRKLLRGSRKWPAVYKSATYVLVMSGWPRFPINARKFLHFSPTRGILVNGVEVGSSSMRGSEFSQKKGLLENYLSDAEKEVKYHRRIKSGGRLVEFIQVNYTLNNYDYWMRDAGLPLTEKTKVKAEIKADVEHIVNLVAEISYDNGKLAIFGSPANKEAKRWEVLSITDLYQIAEEYALTRGWSSKKIQITRIGINTGLPRQMPYQERYGIIELEKGQPGIKEDAGPKINNAPYFFRMANCYKAKGEFEKAIKYYQLAEKLNPADAWIHSNSGDIYLKMGDCARAIEEYKKAIQLEPDVGWFYFALGKVYEKKSKINLAKKSYQKALKIDPSGIWARYALKNLGKGKS